MVPMTPRKAHDRSFPTANWMWNFDDIFHDMPLKFICLPGTHDSATANLQREWTDERSYDSVVVTLLRGLENNFDQFGPPSDKWIALWGCARATNLDIKAHR